MPEFYWKSDRWIKDCAKCRTPYESSGNDWNEAFKEFRKNFSPRNTTRDGLESSCHRCGAVAEMRIRFGIDIIAVMAAQDHKCAICCVPIEFNTRIVSVSACVDHDHSQALTRGILCRACNLGLGHFKDSIENLDRAIKYLKAWKSERKGVAETIKRDA